MRCWYALTADSTGQWKTSKLEDFLPSATFWNFERRESGEKNRDNISWFVTFEVKPSYIRSGFSSSLIIIVWLFHIFPAMTWKILARFSRLSCHLQQKTTFKAKLLKKNPFNINEGWPYLHNPFSSVNRKRFSAWEIDQKLRTKKWTSLVQNTANKKNSKSKAHFIYLNEPSSSSDSTILLEFCSESYGATWRPHPLFW